MGHKCPEDIRHGLLQKAKANHRYRECGLDNVQIIDCDVLLCPVCGSKAAFLPNPAIASRLIAKDLVRLQRPLLGYEIEFLCNEMGMKTTRLAKFLRTQHWQVMAWIDDKKRIRQHADLMLRLKATEVLFSRGQRSLRDEIRQVFEHRYLPYATNKIEMQLEKKKDRWAITTRYVVPHVVSGH